MGVHKILANLHAKGESAQIKERDRARSRAEQTSPPGRVQDKRFVHASAPLTNQRVS